MSTRYEGAGAKDVNITIFPAGEEVGMDIIPEGQLGLILGYDEVFYIQGTAEELRTLLQEALDKVNEASQENIKEE
jgi:hypothetical protein